MDLSEPDEHPEKSKLLVLFKTTSAAGAIDKWHCGGVRCEQRHVGVQTQEDLTTLTTPVGSSSAAQLDKGGALDVSSSSLLEGLFFGPGVGSCLNPIGLLIISVLPRTETVGKTIVF